MAVRPFLVAALLAGAAAPAAAQSRCNQPVPSDLRRIVNARGQEILYVGGPARFLCTGGVEIQADSAVWTQARGTLELLGAVFYQDSTSTLTAEWANYLGREGQVFARGTVVLTDLETGSVVTGERLDHQRATEERPEGRSIVQGGRPHAVIYRRGGRTTPEPPADSVPQDVRPVEPEPAPAPAADGAQSPIAVDADWMRIEAGRTLEARGEVELRRSGVTAYAREMRYDQLEDHLVLEEEARVVDPRFVLEGRTIDAWLLGGELRRIRARTNARLTGVDLDVRGPLIHLALRQGALQRLQTWRPDVRVPRATVAQAESPDGAADEVSGDPAVPTDTMAAVPRESADAAPEPEELERQESEPEEPEPEEPEADALAAVGDSAQVNGGEREEAGVEEAGGAGTRLVADPVAVSEGAGREAAEGEERAPETVPGAEGDPEPVARGSAAVRGAAGLEGARTRLESAEAPAEATAGVDTAAAAPEAGQPVVIARGLLLRADSVDALAPDQRLERVIAVGVAYGEQVEDSVTAAQGLPELAARDWIRGDTITGHFVDPAAVAGDGAIAGGAPLSDSAGSVVDGGAAPPPGPTGEPVLDRLEVVGVNGTAQSLYRLRRAADPDAPPSINYMVATRIVLHLSNGSVTEVEADGPVDGLFLDWGPRQASPGEGTEQRPPAIPAPADVQAAGRLRSGGGE